MKTLKLLLTATALALAVSSAAQATQSYCVVVKPTSDGFVALHKGPGVQYDEVARLQPYDVVWVDTGQCRGGLCSEDRKWVFVESVPRIDGSAYMGSIPEGQRPTQGWARATLLKETECP